MGIVEKLILEPTLQQFHLVDFLIVFLLLLHLPFIGMLFGSSLFSVIFWKKDKETAAQLINLPSQNPVVWLVLGILPLVCLIFLFRQHFYQHPIMPADQFILPVIIVNLAAVVLLTFYQHSLRIIYGLCGLITVSLGWILLVRNLDLLIFPERWRLFPHFFPTTFAITVWAHFLIFFFESLLLTGAALLFFCFAWPETRLPAEHPRAKTWKILGFALVMPSAIILGLLTLWEITILPKIALSFPIFGIACAIIALLYLIALRTYGMIISQEVTAAGLIMVLTMLCFALGIYKNHQLLDTGNRDFLQKLALKAGNAHDELLIARRDIYEKAFPVDPKLGQNIYEERCSACHRFETKLVGPAYNEVVPKYSGNIDNLKAFILNPQKVNPNLPAMPKPGLSAREAKAVAEYLIQTVSAKKSKE
jgi:cytochrome c